MGILIALDLFAGAGGWDLAARRLGIRALGVESMPEAIATREAAGFETVFNDVWDGLQDPSIVPAHDMLIASPPCQTFSVAGKGAGREALDEVLEMIADGAYKRGRWLRREAQERGFDDRTALVLTPLAYVWLFRPTFIALEQVPTVLPVWEAFAVELELMGYSVASGNLQAEQFGVPQTRKRAILVARNDGLEVRLPTPTHSKYHPRSPDRLDSGVLPWVSMAEALHFGLTERPSPTVTGGGGARRARANRQTQPLHQSTGLDQERLTLISNYGTGGDAQKRGEREASQPAPTITSKADRNKWGRTDIPAPTVAGDPRLPKRAFRRGGGAATDGWSDEAHD